MSAQHQFGLQPPVVEAGGSEAGLHRQWRIVPLTILRLLLLLVVRIPLRKIHQVWPLQQHQLQRHCPVARVVEVMQLPGVGHNKVAKISILDTMNKEITLGVHKLGQANKVGMVGVMDRMVGILSPFIGVGLSSLSSSINTKDTVMASINDPGIGTQARCKGVSMMDGLTTMVPDTDMETTHPVVVVVMVQISALLECVKTTTVVQLVWPL
jgi:hypothetical protein